MPKRPCIVCSTPTHGTRCQTCQTIHKPDNWRTISKTVIANANGQCQLQYPDTCTGTATTCDHINPWLPPTPNNVQAACRPCNASKG